MSDALFQTRLTSFGERDALTAFVLAAVAEGLDTVAELSRHDLGTETVETREGEYKNWDADIFRVDKDVEDGFRARLAQLERPVVLLSEEAGRVEIGAGDTLLYAVADPFDGSWLFKRGVPCFWFSSLALFDAEFNPICCAVGAALHNTITFADSTGAWRLKFDGDRAIRCDRLDAAYRAGLGRSGATDPAEAGVASYAMKPKKFLLPLVDQYRPVIEAFKFLLPNGGPDGFGNVAEGKVDVYFGPGQPFVDVFSGLMLVEQAGGVVTDFEGRPLRASDNAETVHNVLAAANPILHEKVLSLIARCI
jgi:histidinol-phosphatase